MYPSSPGASESPPVRLSSRSLACRHRRRHCRLGQYIYPAGYLARLPVQPDVFHAPAVVDAVDHDCQPLDIRLTAGRRAVVEDDRPGALFLQLLVDFPDDLPALLLVGFDRLAIEQLLHRLVAIPGDVEGRAAGVILVELLVGIIDPAGAEPE